MSADERLQGRTRWSMAARCPRMAAYGLLGEEPEAVTERQRGRFQRGHDAQRYYAGRLVEKYGEDAIQTEKAVAWPAAPALPAGELHTDVVVKPERLAIEVKHSEYIDSNFGEYMTQLAGQVHWDPDVDAGALVFLDRDYQEIAMFPLVITDEWVGIVEGIADEVIEAGKTGKLPARTCERPGDAVGKFCPFAETCFADWEPEPAALHHEAEAAATEAYLADRDLKAAKSALKPLEERWEAAKEALAEVELGAGENACGNITVKVTEVSGSQRFSLAKALKSGVWTTMHDELFHPFISRSDGHKRYSFYREGDEPLNIGIDDDEPPPF